MINNYLFFLFLMLTYKVAAQVSTGFEEPFAISTNTNYVDAASPLVQHNLNNNSGQPSVMHIGSGGEMGFVSTFFPTRNGSAGGDGLTDGDAFGVHNSVRTGAETGFSGAWTSGNALVFEDTDGTVRIEFDEVSLAGTATPRFQMDYWLDEEGYESGNGANDRLFIGIRVNGTTIVPIVDTDGGGLGGGGGNDLDDGPFSIPENTVNTIDFDLSPFVGDLVQLVIEIDFDAASEEGFFDNIVFTEGSINTPVLSVESRDFIDKEIDLYPNPSNGGITIAHNQIVLNQLDIVNVNGKIVASYPLKGTLSKKFFEVSQLAKGTYFAKITTGKGGELIKKLIIK